MTDGFDRRTILALAGGAAFLATSARAGTAPLVTGAIGDFDFQEGNWVVRHHSRSTTGVWSDFGGEVSMRKVMNGQGNVEDHAWSRDGKQFHAMGLRTFDPARSVWSIFWLDSRWPTVIGAPVVGGFTGKVGTFYSDENVNGVPTRSRFLWTVDDADHCRWEQAISVDEGRNWDTNWRMAFTRA